MLAFALPDSVAVVICLSIFLFAALWGAHRG